MMAVLVLGLPGVGKTTLSRALERETGAIHISIGNLLRDLATSSSGGNRDAVDAGYFVDDELAIRMMRAACSDNCAQGYLIDGFPRTATQARRLMDLNPSFEPRTTFALILDAPEPEVRRRLLWRSDPARRDDHEAAISTRIELFRSNIAEVHAALAALQIAEHVINAVESPRAMLRSALGITQPDKGAER